MDFERKRAIYLQIGDYIYENILLNKWEKGDKIPSIREMAMNIEVNPNTVMRTYTYLQDKGIIFNQRGIGFFISDQAYELTLKLKKQGFISNDVPKFFKTMELVKMGIKDIVNFYEDYKQRPGVSQ